MRPLRMRFQFARLCRIACFLDPSLTVLVPCACAFGAAALVRSLLSLFDTLHALLCSLTWCMLVSVTVVKAVCAPRLSKRFYGTPY